MSPPHLDGYIDGMLKPAGGLKPPVPCGACGICGGFVLGLDVVVGRAGGMPKLGLPFIQLGAESVGGVVASVAALDCKVPAGVPPTGAGVAEGHP